MGRFHTSFLLQNETEGMEGMPATLQAIRERRNQQQISKKKQKTKKQKAT